MDHCRANVSTRGRKALRYDMSLSPSEFRKAMGSFATGVTIITVDLDGEVHGRSEERRVGTECSS